MSNMVKKVLIEKGELDRLQQRQIRDYSPELQSMVRLQSQMVDVLAQKDMSADAKIQLLNTYQSRFDKLQKETGVLRSSTTAAAVPTPEAAPVIEEEDEQAEEDEDPVNEAVAVEQVSPARRAVRTIGFEPMYENKARRLMLKLMENRDVLKANKNGELVVNGQVEPGTNFNNLFQSMVGRTQDLTQPGINKFLGALHQIGVKTDDLSGKELKALYAPRPPPGSVSQRLATLRNDPALVEPHSSKQGGKGFYAASPPGKRARVLYVY